MSDDGGIVADLLASVTPRETSVRVLLDQSLHNQKQRLEAEFVQARQLDGQTNSADNAPAIARRIADLEDQIEEAKVEFTFRAVGRRAWSDLLAKHPPTKEQRRQMPQMDFNPITFLAPSIAASLWKINGEEATLTVEQVADLEDRLNEGQFAQIWQACLDANMSGDSPKSPAAGLIRAVSEKSANTAVPEGFLGQLS